MKSELRVGLVDSGTNPKHPQVETVADGVGLRLRDGRVELDADWEDVLGHGTAATATIHGHAPRAVVCPIRIFRRRLEAPVEVLLRAMEWAACHDINLLNLSLGCTNWDWQEAFREEVVRCQSSGMVILAAREAQGLPSLPGMLEGVIAVRSDPELEGREIRYQEGCYYASPWARQLNDLPREKNFHGVSLAVANLSGMVARLMVEHWPASHEQLGALLRETCLVG